MTNLISSLSPIAAINRNRIWLKHFPSRESKNYFLFVSVSVTETFYIDSDAFKAFTFDRVN